MMEALSSSETSVLTTHGVTSQKMPFSNADCLAVLQFCTLTRGTSPKVAGSIPDDVIGFPPPLSFRNPSGRTTALALTQLLTEMIKYQRILLGISGGRSLRLEYSPPPSRTIVFNLGYAEH
jgi:hypothetical protein